MSSLDGMLLGTDSIRFLRQAHVIAEHGHMPSHDNMRNYPTGRPSNINLTFFPYLMTFIHRALSMLFPSLSLKQVFTLYPVAFFLIACLILYMLAKALTDRNVALLVISFAIVVPDLVNRSLAGFADRDMLSLNIGLISYLFYIRAHELRSTGRRLIAIGVSGIFMGLLGLTWQGVAIFSLVVIGTEGLMCLFGNYSKNDFYMYATWAIPMWAMLFLLKNHIYRNILEPFVFLAIVVPGTFLAFSIISLILRRVAPRGLSKWFLLFTAFGVVIVVTIFPTSRSLIPHIWERIQYPFGTDRLFTLIEELQPKGFIDWIVWPGVFFSAVWGGIVLFAFRFASMLQVNRWLTAVLLQIVVATIVLSRVLSSGLVGQNTVLTNTVYTCSLAILLTSIMGGAIYLHLGKPIRTISLDRKILFPLTYLIFMLICSRAANRFEFILAPILLIIGCYGVVRFFCWLVGHRALDRVIFCLVAMLAIWEMYMLAFLQFKNLFGEYQRPVLIATILFSVGLGWIGLHQVELRRIRFHFILARTLALIVMVALTLFSTVLLRVSYITARRTKPLVNSEMSTVLNKLREQTSEHAVIAASWEWGAVINLIAERTTIVDEEQIAYWVYLMSRHVIMGQSEREALQFLKAHEATHLMLSAREIYLLPEVSYVSADSSGDRQISLSVYGSLVQRTESDSGTVAFRYSTPHPVMAPEVKSMLTEDESECWMLCGVYLAVNESNTSELLGAVLEFQREDQVLRLPPQEIYFRNHLIHNGETTVPCTILIHTESENPFEWYILYLSPIARNSLAVRLYLFDECSEFFKLMPCSANPIGQFAKIWEIKYPPDIVPDSMHLHVD